MDRFFSALPFFVTMLLVFAVPASAVDGLIEINQASAAAGGVTSGDTAGFPVTISESGSYVLTSNLDVTGEPNPAQTTVIEVTADNVTIDLNGMSIIGPNVCIGTPPSSALTCNFSVVVAPFGIGVNGGSAEFLKIHNGVIRGMGTAAALCDKTCVLEKIRATANGTFGLGVANEFGLIDSCYAYRNGGVGLASAVVRNSIAQQNDDDGISVRALAQGNTSGQNRGVGIQVINGLVLDNFLYDNNEHGIEFVSGAAAWGRNRIFSNNMGHTTGTAGLQVEINDCGGAACP